MDLKQLFDKSQDGTPGQIARFATMFDGREPDPEMAAVLRVLVSSDPKPFYEVPPKLARKHPLPPAAVKLLLKERGESTDPEAVGAVDDRSFDGAGGEVKLRVYKPASAAADQMLPVVLYIHGGGWVIADLETYDSSARAIANGARCVVVSTHYRRAPEHKFPAAHEDTYAAYKWVLANARALAGVPPAPRAQSSAPTEENGVSDGLWTDAKGRMYISALQENAVKVREPNGGDRVTTLVRDERLRWPDTFSEGPDGAIYVTAASHIQDMPWYKPQNPIAVRTALFRIEAPR